MKTLDEINKNNYWQEVKGSSHIAALAWERYEGVPPKYGAIGRLWVKFIDDGYCGPNCVYSYEGVKYDSFRRLWKLAPSKGRYFASRLRLRYAYKQQSGGKTHTRIRGTQGGLL